VFAFSWPELAIVGAVLAVVSGLVAVPVVIGVVLWAKRKR
jgi:hypothetical protein